MNMGEGVRRIAIALRCVGDGVGAVALLLGFYLAFSPPSNQIVFLCLGIAAGGVLAGAGRLLGWILLGFVNPRDARKMD